MSNDITNLREKIDSIDETLLDLLNQRAEIARQVGEAKKQGVVYRPEREAQVHRRLHERNNGPLSNTSVSRLFTEIISSCRAQEKLLSVACLGPMGTFSEQAALKQFGSDIELEYCVSIDDVFRAVVADDASYGVVPLENSTEGAISRTLDLLFESTLSITGEVSLPIKHNLLAANSSGRIDKIYSHAQSLAQCQKWLKENHPNATQIPVASNAAAAELCKKEVNSCAIAGLSAAEQYGLKVLHVSIEDRSDNTTRFGVISNTTALPSGVDKTSIVTASRHEPGAIYELLEPLASNGISMTRLESRPSALGLWEYMFFIDLEGHRDDSLVAKALAEVETRAGFFKVLGSYPKTI